MAFLNLLDGAVRAAGHGISTGATAVADELTGRNIPELGHARRHQEGKLRDATRTVDQNAPVVGSDFARVFCTTGTSVAVLAQVLADPAQAKRLGELLGTYDLKGFLKAITNNRGKLPPDFFPCWIKRAGGYFPKLAQVLSIRADLIRDREVLDQLSQCLEDMPAKPKHCVLDLLSQEGFPQEFRNSVGEVINAGTVAQVHELSLDGHPVGVLKIAWPETRSQMQTDFRLFEHAQAIMRALNLDVEAATQVAMIFKAVGKNETAVLKEFDLRAEARTLHLATELCAPGGGWDRAYASWVDSLAPLIIGTCPPPIALYATMFLGQMQRIKVRVPEPLDGMVTTTALGMTRAAGESLHRLIADSNGETAERMEVLKVLLVGILPFIGWLLLCKSTSHVAHVDPHPGNFRWDASSQELWVLDWGCSIQLPDAKRQSLCNLVVAVAEEKDSETIAAIVRSLGVRSNDTTKLATLMRGMLNASGERAARDEINDAAAGHVLEDVDTAIVPVIRCLAVLGGLLKKAQRQIQTEYNQNLPLSLASLWQSFARAGLTEV